MIKVKIVARNEKAQNCISEMKKNLKPKDLWFMKKMGSSVEIADDNSSYTIVMNQIQLKALGVIRNNPKLCKQYEEDLAKKTEQDYEYKLLNEGLVKGEDYVMEVIR